MFVQSPSNLDPQTWNHLFQVLYPTPHVKRQHKTITISTTLCSPSSSQRVRLRTTQVGPKSKVALDLLSPQMSIP